MNSIAHSPLLLESALSRGQSLPYAAPMSSTPDDSALMLRYRDGDVAAFETLYRRHSARVYRYLLRQSGRPEVAEDVYQEVWAKIIGARSRYQATAKFSTFLFRVARNCFIDYLRRNKRHTNAVEAIADELPDGAAGPADKAEISEARQRLIAALDQLPDEQRDAFLLHEEGGLTLDEIAFVTDANRETVKSRLRYASNKLKRALAGED